MKKLLTLFLVILSLAIVAQGVSVKSVNPYGDSGSRSLTGSYVAFDPAMGGDNSFIAGQTQNFIFRTESFTPDWEYVYDLWLQFPADWVVNSVSVFGTPICTGGGEIGTLSFSVLNPPNAVDINHSRFQSFTDHCIVYYMVNVTSAATSGNAEISWYWDGDSFNDPPHNPCSDDGYTPVGQDPCDEMINPPAVIPQYDPSLQCNINTIFSQPPFLSNNAYFSDEGTFWLDQRIYDNFSGLGDAISGITFWGVMYYQSNCYTPGPQNFIITFYKDNAGTVGNLVQSYSVTVTPTVTGATIVGAVVLRYDVVLPFQVLVTNGWVMLYKLNPLDSGCSFAWANADGDNSTAFSQGGGPISYQGDDVAFCLTSSNAVPVSNWALFIGIGLILAFAVIRFRKLF